MLSVENYYHKKIESGEWEPDLSQHELALKLSHLSKYINQVNKNNILNIFNKRKTSLTRGFYIYGKVGRGKSVLMDMFYTSLETKSKLRIHFHLFMQEIHKKIKDQRVLSKRGDPIKYVAKNISKKYKVICLDEFQVNDAADAMILQRLFEKIFQKETLVVLTSNTEPNELYFNGINRPLFFPFINLIKKKCEVFEIISKEDYRLKKLKSNEVYFTPVDELNKKKFMQFFYYLSNTETFTPVTLDINARKIHINKAANGIGLSTFEYLCLEPRNAEDYITIASFFKTFFIENIPIMRKENKNEAIRFMNLIDIFYEYKVNVICLAEGSQNEIYEHLSSFPQFNRTISRLIEMKSEVYLSLPYKKI